jgi:hypothetical protein
MNPKSPLDDFFRRKLSHFEVPPSKNLWENIQLARLKKTKPTGKRWSLLIFASAFLLSSALFFQLFNNPVDAISKDNSNSHVKLSSLENEKKDIPQVLREIEKKVAPFSLDVNDKKIRIPSVNSKGAENEEVSAPSREIHHPLLSTADDKGETKDSFSSFPALAGTNATLPHELSLYSEYLPVPFKKKLWFAKIDFLLSQDFIHNTLSSKSALFEEYAALRNKHEHFNNSNSFMIRMGISTIKGWGLRSGIQYSRITQSFTRQMPDASHLITKNTFESLDIPLLLTKERAVGKLRVGVSFGTYLNMTFNQQGSFYGPTGTLIEFTSSKPGAYPAFKNRLGASIYNGLSLSYPLGNSLELMVEPYLRTRIPSISADDYVLDQKIWYGGLFLGIRKQIGKGFYLP